MEDVTVIASMMDVKALSEEVTPEVVEMVIEMIADQEKNNNEIVTDVKIKTGQEITTSDVEMVEHITRGIGENKAVNLVESDLELITMLSDSKSNKENISGGITSGANIGAAAIDDDRLVSDVS